MRAIMKKHVSLFPTRKNKSHRKLEREKQIYKMAEYRLKQSIILPMGFLFFKKNNLFRWIL